ncbi:crotonase/enoyl-CoA hydratase family protein [Corynebacterium sp. zg254]|uniref:Crotonase/enoyl-CoA hydratase family protein n=1 Tax=Corynebacterium zhongnanshanii TaxID=2768834 RepID=A0ABQ6VCF0_9CORY|nr:MULTISPECIES: crotonase/enoyl-CoA hydratase family protein [Corynebacterium]KAB3519143.1 crotonase/enoyl-CoA hydratase family protein [Corynebacterium zhongnanshanii]MCR5914984.1 crotonase/enoyl-CoA hydratase family protein [Corynebacterium sp. zg254]
MTADSPNTGAPGASTSSSASAGASGAASIGASGAAPSATILSSETTDNITLRISDEGIAYVLLDRPEKLNALTIPMLKRMIQVSRQIQKDKSIRAVILTGANGNFSSGLDFGAAFKSPREIVANFASRPWRGTNTFQEGPWCWRRLDVPVIAAVPGYCFGGGLQIALASDYRFTSADAAWSVLEAKWGLVPDMSGVQALKQVVGADVAKRLSMGAEIITGAQAVEYGLASEVAEDPLAAAEELARVFIDRSPDAVAQSKKLIDETWTAGPRKTFFLERLRQAPLLFGQNAKVAKARAAAAKAGKKLPGYKPRRSRHVF